MTDGSIWVLILMVMSVCLIIRTLSVWQVSIDKENEPSVCELEHDVYKDLWSKEKFKEEHDESCRACYPSDDEKDSGALLAEIHQAADKKRPQTKRITQKELDEITRKWDSGNDAMWQSVTTIIETYDTEKR
jgi:hypothetical protein